MKWKIWPTDTILITGSLFEGLWRSILINISDYDSKVDGDLPLENILTENHLLREMIQSMNVGKKWLFTNAGENHANRVVEILGLQGLFDGTTFCNYLEHQFVCKPDRKAFEKAMKQAGVQDSSLCYFVDDSAPNVDMALKLGWTAVHLNEDDHHHYYPQQTPNTETLTPARLEIKSIFDLPKTFPQFWNKK
ncbi:hypothetical protein BX616_007097 [Lobosporangium transversale]|nr:hypothetical protein BX616_007097 [Lobosporangium transversale]